MTFLNPFVLFGLAAATIPVLIHLLNKRKLRTIEFSTLSFLKELQKNTMRKITLRQWLLLILRTLIILCLVLAFSRPALKGTFGTSGSRVKSTFVIILDNTASMDLQNERGKFLFQAKTQALNVISMLQEGDDAFLIRLSDIPENINEESTHDIKRLQALIHETRIEYGRRTINEGLRVAAKLLDKSTNFNKEVYIITDGQLSTLVSEKAKNDEEKLFDARVKFYYLQLSNRQIENVGIEKIIIPPALLKLNKPVTIQAVIKNYGQLPVHNHTVSISFENVRVMQKSVTLNADENATIDFSVVPTHTGFLSGYVDSEDDLFEPDNKYYFSIYIPEQIRINVIAAEELYSHYITAALSTANTPETFFPILVSTSKPSQLTSTIINASDVLILSGINELQESQYQIILQYVSEGGSVLFFPSNDTTHLNYPLFPEIGIFHCTIAHFPSQYPLQFGKIDLDFPIFQGMFETAVKKIETIESPDITTSLTFSSTENIRTIVTLTNNQTFLWLGRYHSGTVIGCSVPASTQWSDFPLKGIFVPLLYQTLLYLSSQVNLTLPSSRYICGEKIEFFSSSIKKNINRISNNLNIIDPEHRTLPIQSFSKLQPNGLSEKIFSVSQLPNMGNHLVLQGNDTVFSIPVNISREESKTILASNDEIINSFSGIGINKESVDILTPTTPLQEIVLQSRFGLELWYYFALLAVLIALIEMFIVREKKYNDRTEK